MTPAIIPDSFLAPGLWPLLLAALLPLVLYLLDRRRARRADWPAVRFFIAGRRRDLRRVRIREALLLGARTLGAGAIAYALLRPASVSEEPAPDGTLERRGLVAVLDTSASMGYEHAGGGTSLARARRMALELLDGLDPAGPVVVLRGAESLRERGDDRFDHGAAREAIEEADIAGGRFDLAAALDTACAHASRLPAGAREIVVLTDLQAGESGAARLERWSFIGRRWRAALPNARIAIVDCGDPEAANHRITSFERQPMLAGTDRPLRFTARVVLDERLDAPRAVRLVADGETVAEEPIPADAERGRPIEIEIEHRFRRRGEHRVSIELAGADRHDGLSADDSRPLVVSVHERVDALVVEAPGDDRAEHSSRFIDLALFPRYGDVHLEGAIFRPRRVTRIDEAALAAADAVILADVHALEPGEAELLERYVAEGGGLLVFAGTRAAAARINALLYCDERGLLPAPLLAAAGPHVTPISPSGIDTSHPALRAFADPARGDLGKVSIVRHWRTGSPAHGARVLAHLDAASPWIVERASGNGTVVLVTTSASPESTDLPETPLFVPFVQGFARYIARDVEDVAPAALGEPLELELAPEDAEATVTVTGPDGEERPAERREVEGAVRLRTAPARGPGFYTFRIEGPGGREGRTVVRAVAADPRESDLRRLGGREIESLSSSLGIEVGRGVPERPAARTTVAVRVEHWPYALLAGLALLLGELFLLPDLGRSRREVSR